MSELRLTQREVARAAGINPAQLSRLMHFATNCTFDSAGRLLHALGVKPKLVECDACADDDKFLRTESFSAPVVATTVSTDGEEEFEPVAYEDASEEVECVAL